MNKTYFVLKCCIFTVCMFFQSSLLFYTKGFCQNEQLIIFDNKGKETCRFSVELAVTRKDQARGLMFRKTMESRAGMFFIFDGEELRHFWMKNTLIPLDIIFIDSNFIIVDIHKGASPLDETIISSRKPAQYVLEINAGKADECRMRKGTKTKLLKTPL